MSKQPDTHALSRKPRRLRRGARLAIAFVAGTVVLSGAGLASAGPAAAAGWCVEPVCPRIENGLGRSDLMLAKDWCGNAQILYRDDPPCGRGSRKRILAPGEVSPKNEDWDAFRIEKRCFMTYSVERWDWFRTPPIFWRFDRRLGSNTTNTWIRVHNNDWATIGRKDCGR